MDDDLWGPPTGPEVEDDSFYVQTVRGCVFYFDSRLDVIEENALNERSCMQVLRILMEKEDAEIDNHEKVSVSIQNNDTCCNVEKIHGLQDANTSSTQSALDEEADTSNLSDAETVETRDSSNAIEDRDPKRGSKLHGDSETVQPAGAVEISSIDAVIEPSTRKGNSSSSSKVTIKSEGIEERSCLSLATNKLPDPIKQEDIAESLKLKKTAEFSATNISRDEVRHLNAMQQSGNSNLQPRSLNKPSEHHCSVVNKSKYGNSGLRHLVSEARQKLRDRSNALAEKTNPGNLTAEEEEEEEEESRKDHRQNVSFQDILTATEPFTMDCLLEMCDGEDKSGETPLAKKQNRSQPETGYVAGRTDIHDELIKNLVLKPARQNPGSNALLSRPCTQNSGSITTKQAQQKSSSKNAGPNKSFIRNTKVNITGEGEGELREIIVDKGDEQKSMNKRKNCSTPSMAGEMSGSTIAMPPWHPVKSTSAESSQQVQVVSDSEISSCDLKEMKTNDLKAIAKALKVTHYYKLKRNDLLQQLTNRLSPS